MSENTTEQAPRRGRPRPQETIERDEAVYKLIHERGSMSRNDIAGELDLEPTIAWLSLDRLRRAGKIRRCAGHAGSSVWACASGGPCP